MPFHLSADKKNCPKGSRKISKKGKKPVKCMGHVEYDKMFGKKKRGCTYARDPLSKRCMSKKQWMASQKRGSKKTKHVPAYLAEI